METIKPPNTFGDNNKQSYLPIDSKKINELFSKVISGDLEQITQFVNDNNMTYYVKDSGNGNSITHVILEKSDSEIKKETKLKLLTYLLKNGAPVDTFNKLSKTPLHLASKTNDYDITKLLLQYGASVTSNDGNKKIPLHYSVQGLNLKHITNGEIASIIPNPINENKIVNREIKNLMNFIRLLMTEKDVSIKENGKTITINPINGINNVLQHIDNIIKKNITLDAVVTDTQSLMDINGSNYIIANEVVNKKVGDRREFIDKFENIFGKSVQKIDMNALVDSIGWGIDDSKNDLFVQRQVPNKPPPYLNHINNKNNQIFTVNDDDTIQKIDKLYQELLDEKQKVVNNLRQSTNRFNELLEKINKPLDNILQQLYYILYYARVINSPTTNVNLYLSLMIYDTNIAKMRPLQPGQGNITQFQNNSLELNANGNNIQLPNLHNGPTDNNLKIDTTPPANNNPKIDPKNVKISVPNLAHNIDGSLPWQDPSRPISSTSFYIRKLKFGQNLTDIMESPLSAYRTSGDLDKYTMPIPIQNIPHGTYNILHLLFYARDRIKICMHAFNDKMQNLDNSDYYEIYNNDITNMVCEIQNIDYLLTFMYAHNNFVRKKILAIKNYAMSRSLAQPPDLPNRNYLEDTMSIANSARVAAICTQRLLARGPIPAAVFPQEYIDRIWQITNQVDKIDGYPQNYPNPLMSILIYAVAFARMDLPLEGIVGRVLHFFARDIRNGLPAFVVPAGTQQLGVPDATDHWNLFPWWNGNPPPQPLLPGGALIPNNIGHSINNEIFRGNTLDGHYMEGYRTVPLDKIYDVLENWKLRNPNFLPAHIHYNLNNTDPNKQIAHLIMETCIAAFAVVHAEPNKRNEVVNVYTSRFRQARANYGNPEIFLPYHTYIQNSADTGLKQLDDTMTAITESRSQLNEMIDNVTAYIDIINKNTSLNVMDKYRESFTDFTVPVTIDKIFNKKLNEINRLSLENPPLNGNDYDVINYLSTPKDINKSILITNESYEYHDSSSIKVRAECPNGAQIFRMKNQQNNVCNIKKSQTPVSIEIDEEIIMIYGDGLINEHLYHIRYNTIVKILEHLHPYMTTDLIKIVSNYVKNFNIKDNRKKEQFIYILFAEKIDKLLIEFIRQAFSNRVNSTQEMNYNTIFGKQLILYDDAIAGFSLNLGEIYHEIIDDFYNRQLADSNNVNGIINDNTIFNELFKSTLIIKNDKPKANELENMVYSQNYKAGDSLIENSYFYKDLKQTELLLERGSDINHRDSAGNSPIYYAINNLDSRTITLLLKYNAKIVGIKNNMQLTPLEHLQDLFNIHSSALFGPSSGPLGPSSGPLGQSSGSLGPSSGSLGPSSGSLGPSSGQSNNISDALCNNLCKSYTNAVKKFINEDAKFKNNYIYFMDIIMPMMIIMYNQYLFTNSLNYNNGWTYDDQIKLTQILNKYNIHGTGSNIGTFHQTFSFVKLTKNEIKDIIMSGKNLHVILNYIKSDSNDNNKDAASLSNFKKLENQIKDEDYLNIIREKIINLNNTITKDQHTKDEIKARIDNYDFEYIVNRLAYELEHKIKINKKLYIGRFKTSEISKFYYDVFKALNDDGNVYNWRTYNRMWELYIKSPRLMNIENIHLALSYTITQILDKLAKNKNNDKKIYSEIYDEIEIINKYYKKNLLNVINDYDTRKKDNYVKREFVNICKHIIHHIGTQSLFYTIVKFFYKYFKTRSSFDFDNKGEKCIDETNIELGANVPTVELINKVINALIIDETTGTSLKKLLNDCEDGCYRFEESIIKTTLSLYYEDDDPDKDKSDLQQIFSAISQILELNTVIPITNMEKSKIMDYLKTNIIEYYKNCIYQQTILTMRDLFEAYNRFIMNESKYLDMLELLLEKIRI